MLADGSSQKLDDLTLWESVEHYEDGSGSGHWKGVTDTGHYMSSGSYGWVCDIDDPDHHMYEYYGITIEIPIYYTGSFTEVKSMRMDDLPVSDGSNGSADDWDTYKDWTANTTATFNTETSNLHGYFPGTYDAYYKITFANGTVIDVTYEHPTFVKQASSGVFKFVKVQDLTTNDQVMDVNKNLVGITSIELFDDLSVPFEAVNMNVEDCDVYFIDGILFHNGPFCFMPEQLISMADGDLKEIQHVDVGDMVLTYDQETDTIKESQVNEIMEKDHSDVYEIELDNGKIIKPTGNHPILIDGKGWSTVDGYSPNHGGGDGTIEEGDFVFDVSSGEKLKLKINRITYIPGLYTTYNFLDMEYKTIIADGIITHNSGK
jgi:hypothetical protein